MLVFGIARCGFSETASQTAIEQDVAKIARGGNKAKQQRILKLIQYMDVQFPENTFHIARQTASRQRELDNDRKKEKPQDWEPVLKFISNLVLEEPRKASFTDYIFTYYFNRSIGIPHERVLKMLKQKSRKFKKSG